MATVVRHEFLGSTFWFVLLCLTGIGIPMAVLYLLNGTITVHHEVEEPEALIDQLRYKAV